METSHKKRQFPYESVRAEANLYIRYAKMLIKPQYVNATGIRYVLKE